jgi:hypothetical protein
VDDRLALSGVDRPMERLMVEQPRKTELTMLRGKRKILCGLMKQARSGWKIDAGYCKLRRLLDDPAS